VSLGTDGTVPVNLYTKAAAHMNTPFRSTAPLEILQLQPPKVARFHSLVGMLSVVTLAWAAIPLPSAAQTAWLVTPEEASASRVATMPLVPRTTAAPGAPRINLLAPALPGTVNSPTRIQLRFETTLPATIKPESFKVLYGAFKIDITGRITSASKVTAQGIDVPEAALPKGSHRLWLEIQDSAGRQGTRQVDFVVE
jgi:hypothetical protein